MTNPRCISAAHILPQSAGGTEFTLACTDCNSKFGSRQDKWFGEYIYLLSNGRDLFKTRHQTGRIAFDGIEVGGEVRVADDGALEVLILRNNTAPAAWATLDARFKGKAVSEMSVRLPLLRNQWLVTTGFVTAAYFLWFREFGYAWALQRHLDPVRRWILAPSEGAIPKCAVARVVGQVFEQPWIGFGTVSEHLVLMTGIADRVVFFPTADYPNLYDFLPSDYSALRMHNELVVRGFPDHDFRGPFGVVFKGRVVISPDVNFGDSRGPPAMLLFPEHGEPPQFLFPVSEEQARDMRLRPEVKVVSAAIRIDTTAPLTGMPNEP